MSSRADKLTGTDKVREIYSDFFTSFAVHPDTNQLVRLVNENAVKRSIRSLVFTNQYDRLFHSEIKCGIQKILFEDISDQTTQTLKSYITNVITNYEPRCKLLDVQITSSVADHSYNISIFFLVINKSETQSLNVTLYRVR